MQPTPFDPDLVRRAQRGEPQAVDHLLQQCAPLVMRTCLRYASPAIDPEDAAQDALAAVFERLPTLRDPASFAAWSRQIARRKAIKPSFLAWFRQRLTGPDPEHLASDEDPEGVAICRERAALVQRRLEALDDNERIAVERTHMEGLTCREVAEQQGWNHATTRRRKQRGEATLRTRLRRDLEEPGAVEQPAPPSVAGRKVRT